MAGTVLIGCPTCGRRYRYDAGRFGSRGVRIRCRTCEAVMRVDIPAALQPAPGDVTGIPENAASVREIPLSTTREMSAEPTELRESSATPAGDAPQADDSPQDDDPPQTGVALQAEAPHATAGDAGRPRAVVAEPDPTLRHLLASSLEHQGYEVESISDGLEVRRFLAGWRPRLVVLNVFLPHVLGVTLCSEIKRHPELQETRVLLVGSLYRRDRFMRNPDDLYGADGFLDGNRPHDEIRRDLDRFCGAGAASPTSVAEPAGDEWDELTRLARIVVGDIILYNPDTADRELAAGRFLEAFAHEIREGEALVVERFSPLKGHGEVYQQTVKEAVARHCSAAGMHAGLRT